MASVKPKPRVANNSTKRKDKPTSTGGSLKGKDKPSKSSSGVQKKPKTKSTSFKDAPKRKKRRQYTEKELDIQKLNMITPAGVQKPKGKKKGKVFVDDQESMMTLLAMVNAEKEGQIESKMARSRQMEEIRQARQQEMEKRQTEKKAKLEDTKDSLKRQKNKKPPNPTEPRSLRPTAPNIPKKRVSFG